MREFTQIVSLGNMCATSYNIRRHFGHGEAFPFDWWITPLPGLVALLDRFDANWLYDPAALKRSQNNHTVVHEPTGIQLHHEFPRVGKADGPVSARFLAHIQTPRARTAYLMEKFLGLNRAGERILFIRGAGIEPPGLREKLQCLFGQASVDLAFLPMTPRNREGDPWYGDTALWDRDLDALDVKLANPSLKPFKHQDIATTIVPQ